MSRQTLACSIPFPAPTAVRHRNVQKLLEELLIPDAPGLLSNLAASTPARFARLNAAVARLIEEFSLVGFVPLDISDEDSMGDLLLQIDTAIQYGEDADVKTRDFEEGQEDDDGDGGSGGEG